MHGDTEVEAVGQRGSSPVVEDSELAKADDELEEMVFAEEGVRIDPGMPGKEAHSIVAVQRVAMMVEEHNAAAADDVVVVVDSVAAVGAAEETVGFAALSTN